MATDLQEGFVAERETAVGPIVTEKWDELDRGNFIKGAWCHPLRRKYERARKGSGETAGMVSVLAEPPR
jgi:hypothetical protein